MHLSDCLWNTPTPQLESQIVLACVQRRPFIVLWNSCQGLSEFLYAYTQVSFLWPFFTRPGPRPFRALVRSERPGLKYTSQDAVHHIHRLWRDIIEYLLLRLSQKWPTQPCAPNSRVWRLGKMFVEKKRVCVNCDLLFAILIAHCQAAATWFHECSTKNSRQVNLDTTDSHLDLLN